MPTTKVLATVCARGGSKGVSGKNVRLLLGKPLLAYAIECARACPEVGHLALSTDSEEIAAVAERWGLTTTYRRPPPLASDTAAKVDAIRHLVEHVESNDGFLPDIVVDLDVGVPLRRPQDISGCLAVLRDAPRLDACVTVYEAERNPYFNMVEFSDTPEVRLVKQPVAPVVRRQDAPSVYSVTPSVFAWRRQRLNVAHLFEGRWGAHLVPRERAIDIDSEIDLQVVAALAKERKPT